MTYASARVRNCAYELSNINSSPNSFLNISTSSPQNSHKIRESRESNSAESMPHHPSEEEAPEGIYEKVAKNPSSVTETTASDHEGHHNEHAPDASGKASAQDFQSKGPQIPMNMDDLPPKEGTKEELKARAAELNKE